MDKQIITFSANEQCLQKTGGVDCYASNTVAYIEAHFDLGTNWSGYDSVRAVWFTDFVSGISTVLDSDGVCIVPHEVLTRKSAVKVNLVGSIADGDVLTDRLTTCPVTAVAVKCNAKVTGANSTPITPSEYEQFVQNVKADADRAEAGATAAEQSAVNANASADEAEASAQNASESASASAVSASDSARSATASAGYAQNASEIAVEVEVMKNEVELAKDKVLGMRATAETLEAGSDATASYSDGLLTLGIPRGDRGEQGIQGETGATPNLTIGAVETLEPTEDATATITGTAEEPVLNLGLPKGDTGEVTMSQLSALLPTDTASGDIVTIPDGQSVISAESLKVALSPIQDLNGYDKPWAGGAGKNKFPTAEWYTEFSASANNLLVGDTSVFLPAGTYTLSFEYYTEGISSNQSFWRIYSEQVTYCDTTKQIGYGGLGLLMPTSWTQKVVTFTTTQDGWFGIDNGQLRGGVHYRSIQLESGSTATSWTPYSNICPISGHTEVDTQRTGKNLWDDSIAPTDIEAYSISGNKGTYKGRNLHLPNGTYTFSYNGTTNYYIYGNVVNADGSWVSTFRLTAPQSQTPTFTLSDRQYAKLYMASGAESDMTSGKIQLEVGSTATDYEPYQGTTYTTNLGRTVYGGTLDVVSGELNVNRAMVTLDGTQSFVSQGNLTNTKHYSYDAPNMSNSPSVYSADVISDKMPTIADNSDAIHINHRNVGIHIWIPSDKTPSVWFAENPTIVVYPIATPQTIQLTPQEVQLLLGTNNVWSDGNVTLVYSADIQKWVEKKLNANSTTSMLTMSRPMVQTETTETEETETETAETE